MNAGKEFNYFGYRTNSMYGSLPKQPEAADCYQQKTESYIPFDMKTLYPDEPTETVNILQEIYDTERAYVKSLTVIDEVFVHQLSLACPKSTKVFRSVFGEISAICKTHQILLESLRSKPISEVFTKFIPFLKLYTGYASHYPNALKTFAKLMGRTDFRKALTRIELDPRCEMKNLQAYLIMPIQRIPRYIMLIDNLMSYSTNQQDITNLFKALSGMQGLSEQIQSCMTAYENGERLLTIQLSFGLDSHILEPGRVLLKEGMLYKREINGASNYQETVVFLFNDILLYGNKKLAVITPCKYDPSAILSLRHCTVKLDSIGGCIFIRCGEVGIDLTAYSLGGVTEWYDEIVAAIENAKTLRNTLRKESFKQKTLVFDRGFWRRNRDRLRHMVSTDVTSQVNRVFSRRKPLPKLDESDFLRGQWTTSPRMGNRKRKTVTMRDIEDGGSVSKKAATEHALTQMLLTKPLSETNPLGLLADIATSAAAKEKEEDFDIDRPFDWTDDDEEYVPPEKKIPIKRVASYDEEDRRPRRFGSIRRNVATGAGRHGLAVDDIRRLSYQNRTLEPFNMGGEYDDDEDDIDMKVKGEKQRPWWETESAPPAIKNQKTSLIDTVRNNCSIMERRALR
ncbi:unnamed protein product [Caenorhabditis sp. 36 PRJEB53466]|nr:unnamed protein product [Caenorhabditis sp. 36 PRJEB53466]